MALAIAVVAYLALQVVPLLGTRPDGTPVSHQNDFKHLYIGALLLSEGENPYDPEMMFDMRDAMESEDVRFTRGILPYVYLPFTGLVLWPLSKLSFASAAVSWMMINHILLFVGLFFAARATGWAWNWKTVALIAAAVVFNTAIQRQNNAGQLNMVLFAGSAMVFYGLVKGWNPRFVAGIAAFLMLFKLTPGIFLIWFLLTRRWHHAAAMVILASILMLMALLMAGWNTHMEFLPVLADMGYGKSTWAEFGQTFWRDPYNQSINSFWHHVLVPWNGFSPWIAASPRAANLATWACTAVSLGVFGWKAWRVAPPSASEKPMTDHAEWATFGLAVMVSLLAPSIMWDHYLVQALVPLIVLWQLGSTKTQQHVLRGATVVIAAILSLGIQFSDSLLYGGVLPIRGHLTLPGAMGSMAPVWMSLKLWPMLVLFGLLAWQSNRSNQSQVREAREEG